MTGSCTSFPSTELATPTIFLITATLPATPLPPSTIEPATPTTPPTTTPLSGSTSTQVYIRAEPSSSGATLGLIGSASAVQISGKDPTGNWFQILYPDGPNGNAWVFAEYIVVSNRENIPVVGSLGPGLSGAIVQQVNVRNGPGMEFNTLGTLNPKDVVSLLGKDSGGAWLQIAYAAGPEGNGWVAASYVQISGSDGLPIVAQSGEVIGTGTPTVIPLTTTPTLVAAPLDNDSAESPALNVRFSPLDAGSLIYSSDLSGPLGDATDWISFIPYNPNLAVTLACIGNGLLRTEIFLNTDILQDPGSLSCGDTRDWTLSPGKAYLLKLSLISETSELKYLRFTIRINNQP